MVDWVILTATLVGLSLAVAGVLADPFRDTSTTLQNYLERDDRICTDFCDRFATEPEDDGAVEETGGADPEDVTL